MHKKRSWNLLMVMNKDTKSLCFIKAEQISQLSCVFIIDVDPNSNNKEISFCKMLQITEDTGFPLPSNNKT